ncbi:MULTISPECIES: hypothetical protein [unclassified Pandoraea]|uniref:hypothetical protein n=1 Tax=unclassified Pandoraea TaxID=2624094 RepID=UPI000B401926|nr:MULTISPECIES: hypothetical protein [unclassified Pandoraea]
MTDRADDGMRRGVQASIDRPINANERMGRWLLFFGFLANVLSNSEAYLNVFPGAAKHGVFVLAAVISLMRMPRRSMLAMVVASPLALIYVFGDMGVYAFMVLTLASALPVIWAGINSVIERRDYRYVAALAVVSLIPAMLSWQTMIADGFFTTTYGRPRMLMGYFHPKEAATAFAIPMLLLMMMGRSAKTILWAVAILFLWAVGSRNTAMMLFLGWALRWHGRLVVTVVLIFVPAFIFWLALSGNWYETLDKLLSLRLTLWGEILRVGRVVTDMDMNFSDRFAADNFHVEAYVLIGAGSVLLTLTWIGTWIAMVGRRVSMHSWAYIAFAMLLFNTCFDSGIASTGNLAHIFLWTVMCSPILGARRKAERVEAARL